VQVIAEQGRVPIKCWTDGVELEESAKQQLRNVAALPFIHHHVAVMPDVHWGMGATVGSVLPTIGAIVPAAVGVDLGCGMMAMRTTLRADQLPDNLAAIRQGIERAIPVGGPGEHGSWKEKGRNGPPASVATAWREMKAGYEAIVQGHPKIGRGLTAEQLGTLGTGNHFIEVCLDEADRVWVMLHSGSRGVGNRIGTYFIERAKEQMRRHFITLPDKNLAYFVEGGDEFNKYVEAIGWAQRFALMNRELMMDRALAVLRDALGIPFTLDGQAVNCHHNYVAKEHHHGANVWITRKGAVRARQGDLGIIPGSMGARSFVVRGKGNPESFHSCSHGAGRRMSRGEARRRFTVEDHAKATAGVECRKDAAVIDETPMAYKDINAVIAAQRDLIEVVHTLRQVVCVKG
jgi:tRNA-splicing ligase RtcB (3'-phosphate/5'-hydroxy nucleic acid ligase)